MFKKKCDTVQIILRTRFLSTKRNYSHAKKVVSDSKGLVDFAIELVNSVIYLPDGYMKFFEEFK